MSSLWVPAGTPAQVLSGLHLPDSPFYQLLGFTRPQLRETRDIAAAERRLLLPNFVETFNWTSIRPLLPLRLVIAPTQPEPDSEEAPAPPSWQPRYCRSHYQWLAPEERLDEGLAAWQGLDDFDLILRLFRLRRQRLAAHLGPAFQQPARSAALRPGQFGTGLALGVVAQLELAATGD